MSTGTPQQSPPRGQPPAVALNDVSVRIAGREILTDVSLQIEQGEFIAVLGPNGAGKSTLMKTILGLIPAARGSVSVLGARPQQTRHEIGYLPQRQSFDRATRVRGVDLVTLGVDGTRWGVPLALTPRARERRREDRARVDDVIDLVGATSYAQRAIGELSGGEQQRLLIAAALVRRPRMLILDEPLDSLDLPNQAAVAGLVARIATAEDVAVLLVAHDVNPMLAYLDRVIYLAAGSALAGPVKDVITTQQLTALYGARVEVLETSDGRLVVVGAPDAHHSHADRHSNHHSRES